MHRTIKFEKSPYYSRVAVFEKILNDIKCLPKKPFKRQLTRYSLHKCFYSLNKFYYETDISSSPNHYDKLQTN